MMIDTDPHQAAADAAVAEMVRDNPHTPSGVPLLVGDPPPGDATLAACSPPGLAAVTDPGAADGPVAHDAEPTPGPAPVPGRLRLALDRRRTLHSAIGALRGRSTPDEAPIHEAIADRDVQALVEAFLRAAVHQYLDSQLGRPGTFVHGLSWAAEMGLIDAVWADPAAAAAMPDDGTPGCRYARQLAAKAMTVDAYRFDDVGRPTMAAKPVLSEMHALVPR